MMALRIQDVPANDVPAALRFMREAVAGGWWDGDWMEMLLNMQRDPRTLLEAFADERKREPPARADRADSAGNPHHVPDDDEPMGEDDLDALHALDEESPHWDLATEDDGSTHEFDDGGGMDDDSVDWRADDLGSAHGYNPNRAHDGKFAAGARHDPAHGHTAAPSPARPWRLAFDPRAHQKQIDAHKQTETVHREKSLKLLERMNALKERAQSATPKERAAMQRRFAKLETQREGHRAAAADAKTARAQTGKDLESARAEHAAGRRGEIAARRATRAAQATAEREGIAVIGRHRIGGEDTANPVAPTAEPQHLSSVPEHHFAIGAHRIAGEDSNASAYTFQVPRQLSGLEELSKTRPNYTHVAQPHQAPHQTAESNAARQEHERAARARYEADRPAKAKGTELPQAARVVQLPEARVIRPRPGAVARAKSYLRGLLSK